MPTFTGSYASADVPGSQEKTHFIGKILGQSVSGAIHKGVMPGYTFAQAIRNTLGLTISLSAINNTTVQVNFSQQVTNNTALRNASNYSFSPNLTINSVTPDVSGAASCTYVRLDVSSMSPVTYTCSIIRIEPYYH